MCVFPFIIFPPKILKGDQGTQDYAGNGKSCIPHYVLWRFFRGPIYISQYSVDSRFETFCLQGFERVSKICISSFHNLLAHSIIAFYETVGSCIQIL